MHDFATALAAARSGLPSGFDWLFGMVGAPLVRYFRAQAAWDPDGLANEVLVRAFTQVDQFQGDESGFRAWVFSIAKCRLIDERRATARRPRPSLLDSNVIELFGGDAEREAVDNLGNDWVEEILSALEPDQRDVLVLRVVSDLTIPEIADALGKSLGAVKALQRRGLAAVRRRLEAEAPDFSRVAVPF